MKFRELFFHPEYNIRLKNIFLSWVGRFLAISFMLCAMTYIKWPNFHFRVISVIIASFAAYFPKYRIFICIFGSILWLTFHLQIPFGNGFVFYNILPVLSLFVIYGGILYIAKKIGRKGVFAYPVLSLFVIVNFFISLSFLSFLPNIVKNISWTLTSLLIFSIWPLSYGISNVTSRRPKPGKLSENLMMLHPFWGSTLTPFGKGWSYIKKFEARSIDALAESQISAVYLTIKILILCIIFHFYLKVTSNIYNPFLYMIEMIKGHNPSRLMSLISLPNYFFKSLFSGFIWGNSFVAIARFAGFNIRQNMINPLFSRSIADFWNREYFYFKELMVDFFFFPTFRRLFWLPERLRIFIATLLSAGFGNYIYHFYRDFWIIKEIGFITYLNNTFIYAIYSLILGVSIGISQLINPFTSAEVDNGKFKPHICLSVITFFCIVGLLGEEEPITVFIQHAQIGILEYIKFYAYIFYLI